MVAKKLPTIKQENSKYNSVHAWIYIPNICSYRLQPLDGDVALQDLRLAPY